MHKKIVKVLLLFLGCYLMSSLSLDQAEAADSTVYSLKNGMKVVIHQDKRFPLVSTRLFVHAGSAFESDKEAGISHLLEHMVFKGTTSRPAGRIAGEVEENGGYLNASTSFDCTIYMTDLPSRHWQLGLDIIKDMVFNATIDEKELESEKKVVIAELKRGEDNPGSRLFKAVQASALAGTTYQRPIIGFEKVINSISRKDILNYIERWYQPQSMMLLVCGDVEVDQVKAEIEKLYGALENKRGVPLPVTIDYKALPIKGSQVNIQKGAYNKVYMSLALPSFDEHDPRSIHMDVLTSMLGSGKTSYLYRKYKYEKQLVDSISFSNYGFERIGLLYLSVITDADKLPAFWEEFTKELPNLGKVTFTEQELERVKLNTEDELFRAKETLSGLTSKLGYFEFFDDGERGEANYLYQLRKTSLEDVKGLLDDILVPERLTVSLLVPEASKAVSKKSLEATLKKNWPVTNKADKNKKSNSKSQKTEVVDLGSGRKLILMPDSTLPYIAANLLFTGGDSLLMPQEQGLANVTAAALTRGTSLMNIHEIEDFLEDRAASLSASSGRQTFGISLNYPVRFNADIFKMLNDTLSTPSFKDEELKRVKENQISAIKASNDQPLGKAFRTMFPFLFGAHPYGYLQLGTIEQVGEIERKQVVEFWNKQKRQPWVLAVCGDFNRDEIVAAAKKLPKPLDSAVSVTKPGWTKEKKLAIPMPERKQAHILLTFPTVEKGHADEAVLDVMQSILSGQSGLLFTELRDKQGLGYTVTAIPWNSQKTGALIFYIGTEPEKVEQAKAGFLEIIASLQKDELAPALLERGKRAIEGEYYRSHQSLAARSSEAATLSALGLPLDSSKKAVDKAAKVTAEQIKQAAIKYLDLDKAYWIEVTP